MNNKEILEQFEGYDDAISDGRVNGLLTENATYLKGYYQGLLEKITWSENAAKEFEGIFMKGKTE